MKSIEIVNRLTIGKALRKTIARDFTVKILQITIVFKEDNIVVFF